MPDDKPYRDFMIGKFPRNVPICELVSDSTGPQGGIELLLMTEHLMKLISEREGIDISKPSIPRKGLELYTYSDILSFKESYDKG